MERDGFDSLETGVCYLLLGPVLRLSYTGALIYKDPFQRYWLSRLPFPFKFLMIALGTFMLIYFEEDQQLESCLSVLFYHWWRAGFSRSSGWEISNH